MKKKYVKPQIIIENFSLSTTIAGGCEAKTNNPNSGNCPLILEDEFLGKLNIFTIDMGNVCQTHEPDGYNGICYHVPTENNNVFNS